MHIKTHVVVTCRFKNLYAMTDSDSQLVLSRTHYFLIVVYVEAAVVNTGYNVYP